MVYSTAILYNSNRLAFAYFLTDAFISLMDPLFIFNALPYFVSKVCFYNSYYLVCLCATKPKLVSHQQPICINCSKVKQHAVQHTKQHARKQSKLKQHAKITLLLAIQHTILPYFAFWHAIQHAIKYAISLCYSLCKWAAMKFLPM